MTGALDIRRARRHGYARDRAADEMEVVNGRVVVQFEPIGALWQGSAVEFLAIRILQADRVVLLDVRGQNGQVVLRDAELPGRILLSDPEHVRRAALAHDVHMAARVLSE